MRRAEETRGGMVDTAADIIPKIGELEAEALDLTGRSVVETLGILTAAGMTKGEAAGLITGRVLGEILAEAGV